MAPGKTIDVSANAGEPALLVALKDGTVSGLRAGGAAPVVAGQERWLNAAQQTRLMNTGTVPAEVLRIDFLTPPRQ